MLTKRIGIGDLLPGPPYLSRNFVRGQGLRWFWARFVLGRQTLPTESASQVLPGHKAWARSVAKKQTVPQMFTDLVHTTVPARESSLDSFVLLSRSLKCFFQDENGIRTSQCGHKDVDQKSVSVTFFPDPHISPIVSYAGKVCGGFGQGLILGCRPCPPNRPFRCFQGIKHGHGLSLKNKPCPIIWQTVPQRTTGLAR